MNAENNIPLQSLAEVLEQHLLSQFEAELVSDFDDMKQITNLAGQDCGWVRVYQFEHVPKAAFLMINIAPGFYYFNVHIIPDVNMNIPRFSFEGMVNSMAVSQVSIDLYTDMDNIQDFETVINNFDKAKAAYEKHRGDGSINLIASRLPHMRAFCSPFFFLSYEVKADQLSETVNVAKDYFSDWMTAYKNAKPLGKEQAALRNQRREKIAKLIVDLDPDRDKIVSFMGEEMTVRIEEAMMI